MIEALVESFFAWTRSLQGHLSQEFGTLQPMQYFVIATVALLAGTLLLSGRR